MDYPNTYCCEKAEACGVSTHSSLQSQSHPHKSTCQQTSVPFDSIFNRLDTENKVHANLSALNNKKPGHVIVKAGTVSSTANNISGGYTAPTMDADKQYSNTVPESNATNQANRKAELAMMLHNFIENLAEQLPGISKATSNVGASDVSVNQQQSAKENKIRPTTELLEELQRALTVAPPPSARGLFAQRPLVAENQSPAHPQSKPTHSGLKYGHVAVRIDRGRYYPKSLTNESENVNSESATAGTEGSLSPFCTFKAIPHTSATTRCDPFDMPPAKTYSTRPIVQCNVPEWCEQFDVSLADEQLTIFSWSRNGCLSAPVTYLGRTTIDLQAISRGLPLGGDWCKVDDDNGQTVGHIQISVEFKESTHILEPPEPQPLQPPNENKTLMATTTPMANPNQLIESGDLSTALKKKFEQLEVISERLRSRLFDVTGALDDDFENDLNTIPSEDDDFEQSNKDNAMGLDWLEYCQNRTFVDADGETNGNRSNEAANHH